MKFWSVVRVSCALSLLAALSSAYGQLSGPYKVGSGNTVTAAPLIQRPSTTPCVVTLFSGASFYDFNVENFIYSPPPGCPGPWDKVVFEADINVQPGIQYDRTASVWLGPYEIYFGTTAEPSPSLGPSWHVESDLTQYTTIFNTPSTGVASIGNTLCCGLTSIIYASAQLEFYPLATGEAAPRVADVVYPMSAGPNGGTVTLNTSSDAMTFTANFPLNVVNAYLDVYSQSQSGDEFWYTCVPNNVAGELFSCSNTGFRETEVFVDGQPAGVAPVSPWIFTGGIDPFLWFPLPGVQTLHFAPVRVDLSPFAGVLSNGHQHTVSVSVFNANGYFEDTANLRVYTDHGAAMVTGGVTKNTLAAAPSPVVTENLKNSGGTITGTVDVSSNRSFEISGYVETSYGRINTQIIDDVKFLNAQSFLIGSNFVQDINLGTLFNTQTTVSTGLPISTVVKTESWQFPLTLDIAQIVQTDGNINQTTTSHQTFSDVVNNPVESSLVNYDSRQTDTLVFNSSFQFLGNQGQKSSQSYTTTNSTGYSYNCKLTAANNVLTSFSTGCDQ